MQEMENKERNVINKYLDVDFDFMHGSFWLKIILSKLTTENINHLQYPLLGKKKGISRSLFKIIAAACFFIITQYKKIRNIYQENSRGGNRVFLPVWMRSIFLKVGF